MAIAGLSARLFFRGCCDSPSGINCVMNIDAPLDMEDTGAVTLACCQVRSPQCLAVHAMDVVAVRIVRPLGGGQAVRACASCRAERVASGRWRLTAAQRRFS